MVLCVLSAIGTGSAGTESKACWVQSKVGRSKPGVFDTIPEDDLLLGCSKLCCVPNPRIGIVAYNGNASSKSGPTGGDCTCQEQCRLP